MQWSTIKQYHSVMIQHSSDQNVSIVLKIPRTVRHVIQSIIVMLCMQRMKWVLFGYLKSLARENETNLNQAIQFIYLR
jgi:hypothetical protein